MSEWKEYKLGEFAEINPKVPLKSGNSYSFVEMKDLESSKKYTRPSTSRTLKGGSKFANGDTLFARITPCLENGKICQVIGLENGEGFGSTEFLVFRGKENISDSDFVYYLTRSNGIRETAVQMMTGTSGRQRVEKSALAELEIIAPDLPTQRRIASILSSLDDKIELNNAINKNLEELAQTLFKCWFVDFNFPMTSEYAASIGKPELEGQPYKENGGEMVESELGIIPKGWEVGQLYEYFDVSRGLSYKGSGLTDSKNGVPMHNLNSVYEGGGYKYEGIKYYNGEFKERHVTQPGDIIVTNTEQGHKFLLIGCPAIVPGYFGEIGIFSQHIYRVRPLNLNSLSNQFLYYLLLQPNIRDQVVGCTNGTTVNMLSIDGLRIPKFIVPSLQLSRLFSNILIDFWNERENYYKENIKLSELRDNLLPKLISGQIEIKTDD